MGRCGETLTLAGITTTLVIVNIVGIVIPVWYSKFHNHTVANQTSITSTTNPQCQMTMNIQEGLWQRVCEERTGKECVPDFDEWCDNLDYPEVNDFVIILEIWGDLFILFAAGTIIRSKICALDYKLEMVGAESGLGGILILNGVLVYAYADSEIGYTTTDLHAGWGLCFTTGCVAILVFIYCLCMNIRRARHKRYFPIDNNYSDDDDELILL